jgi:ParB/RepB/Spo0J family partition protein
VSDLDNILLRDLDPHPDNPRLQLREDVVEQLTNEIRANGFGKEYAVLARPYEGRFQLISGHHRAEAARRAGIDTIPAWIREMDDDEAFMQLVLSNTQGELSPLEIGMHALKAVPLSEGGRGRKGGLTEYASRVGRGVSAISMLRTAAEVADTLQSTEEIQDKATHLYEISKAPRELWPVLVEHLTASCWSVADTQHWVKTIREFEIDDFDKYWLPIDEVVERHLKTKEFSPSTVQRLNAAVEQVRQWLDNSGEPRLTRDFDRWLTENKGCESWKPRAVAGYLQRLISSQFVVEGWHYGDWGDHIDKLDDGTVALLLTDPPYGMGYQSDYRLDRRVDHKHAKIEGDATAVNASEELFEALCAFASKLAENAHILVFCNWANEPDMRAMIEKAGYTLRGSLIWDKQATGMGDPDTTFAPAHERILHAAKGSPPLYYRAADVLRHGRCDSSRHPTEKPVGLLKELIEATTVEGQIVADPFGGVASTMAAAKETGRRWFGCEISEEYWSVGEERLLG